MAAGRPTDYNIDEAVKICAWISQGKSLVSYCRQEGAPSLQAVYNWLAKHSEFVELYATAKSDSADAMSDDMLSIADDVEVDQASVAKARLQIDTRKWLSSKLKPKKYGDKIEHEHKGDMVVTLTSKDADI